jgi:predicted ATP-binding protein involved in virulence
VVADLKRTFPKLQFFASSHSPQVIGETPHDEIILLKSDGTWTRPDASIGLHSNEVLREIMGAEIVNAEAAKEFEAISTLIDQGEFEAAHARINDYRQRMGNLPELEASEVYMARVEALAEDGKEEG